MKWRKWPEEKPKESIGHICIDGGQREYPRLRIYSVEDNMWTDDFGLPFEWLDESEGSFEAVARENGSEDYLKVIKNVYDNPSKTPILTLKKHKISDEKKVEIGIDLEADLYICKETSCYVIVKFT